MKDKIITFTIQGPEGSMTSNDLQDLMESVFGNHPEEDQLEYLEPGEKAEYKLSIERIYTEEEFENLPKSDRIIG